VRAHYRAKPHNKRHQIVERAKPAVRHRRRARELRHPLDREIALRAKMEDFPAWLMAIPGIGPITATAIAAPAPPAETFHTGRDIAAWLELASSR
jgi:transposase